MAVPPLSNPSSMKRFLPFALLTLILAGCSAADDGGTDSSLIDMYNDGGTETGDDDTSTNTDNEEILQIQGPTEIPDDLVIPE